MSRIDIELERNMRRRPSEDDVASAVDAFLANGGTIEVLPSTPLKPFKPKRFTSDWFRTRYLEDSDE